MNKSFAFPNLVDSATGETVVVRGDMPHGGDSNLMASAKLQVPSLGFQGQMWDMVQYDDDLAPLRKKLSMHEFRLLFESIEPIFKQQAYRTAELESAIREYEHVSCELAKLSDDDRMNEANSAKQLSAYYHMIGLLGEQPCTPP